MHKNNDTCSIRNFAYIDVSLYRRLKMEYKISLITIVIERKTLDTS